MKIVKILFICTMMVLFLVGSLLAWEAPYDFDQETVVIGSYLAGWSRNWDEGEDLAHLELVEEKFNVNIVFSDAYLEELETDVVAGDKPYDFGFIQTGDLPSVYQYLLPLDDFVTQELLDRLPNVGMTEYEQMPRLHVTIFAIERIEHSHYMPNMIFWNKELFEEYNVTTPYEFMQNDEWTWENFQMIAEQLTDDTTGDGQIDLWGVGTQTLDFGWGDGIFRDQTYVMPLTFGGDAVRYVDGMYMYTANEPEFVQALEARRDLYQSGAETAAYDTIHPRTLYFDGQVAMLPTHASFVMGEDEDFDFGIAYYPRASHMDEHVFPVRTGNAFHIPLTQEKEPEKIIELYLALYQMAEPYVDTQAFEEEYETMLLELFGEMLPDRQAAQIFMHIINNATWSFTADMTGQAGILWNEAIVPVIEGDIGAQAALDELFPLIQGDLDDAYNY